MSYSTFPRDWTSFIRRWHAGDSLADIAAEYGITYQSAYNRRKALGLPSRGRGRPPVPGSVERDQRIADMRNEGATTAEIAEAVGLSVSGVNHVVRLRDLPRVPGRRPVPTRVYKMPQRDWIVPLPVYDRLKSMRIRGASEYANGMTIFDTRRDMEAARSALLVADGTPIANPWEVSA